MDECSVVAMECTPDRDLLLIQIPVAKMKRSKFPRTAWCQVGMLDTACNVHYNWKREQTSDSQKLIKAQVQVFNQTLS